MLIVFFFKNIFIYSFSVPPTFPTSMITLIFQLNADNSYPSNVKENCYKTFVETNIRYGSSVWDPHWKNNIEMLERFKRGSQLCDTLKEGITKINMQQLLWHPLEEHWVQAKVINVYKAMNGTIFIPLEDITQISIKTRSKSHLAVPHFTVDAHFLLSKHYQTVEFYPSTYQSNQLPWQFQILYQSYHLSLEVFEKATHSPCFLFFNVIYKHTPFSPLFFFKFLPLWIAF